MRILCFGDSNTFGYNTITGGRYDRRTRWTSRLQQLLGTECCVIEAGLNGRMTVYEDPSTPGRCGLEDIDKIVSIYAPIDLLIVMLGTNDCKNILCVTAEDIANGVEQIVERAKESVIQPFKTLIISPIEISKAVITSGFGWEFDESSIKKSLELAEELEKVAEKQGAIFLNAAQVTKPCNADGVHLEEMGHEKLAKAIEEIIKSCIFT